MKDKIKELQQLRRRFEELKPITTKGFKTDKELDDYEELHKEIFEEYYEVAGRIEQLEHGLMSEEEKEEKRKLERFLELKAKGEPFDPEEEGLL